MTNDRERRERQWKKGAKGENERKGGERDCVVHEEGGGERVRKKDRARKTGHRRVDGGTD